MRIAAILLVVLSGCVAYPPESHAEKRSGLGGGRDRKEARPAIEIAVEEQVPQVSEPKLEEITPKKEPEIIPIPRVQCEILTTSGDWCAGCKRFKADILEYEKKGWSIGTEPWNQIRFVETESLEPKDRPLALPRVTFIVDGRKREWSFGYQTPKRLSERLLELMKE